MVTAASEMELFLPKSYDIFWSLVILIIVAEIDKQKALNEQQVAKTEAETKKIKAQGEADANAVLNESLTDNVLKQHYIDALSNADQLVVVPDGADTLVQTK